MSSDLVRAAMIRTLPLENGNYGGLLQAYALQQALKSIGVEAVTDTALRFDRIGWKPTIKSAIRKGLLRAGYLKPSWLEKVARDADEPLVASFADRKIRSVQLYAGPNRPDAAIARSVDAFIVGSDQVWRRRYTDVRSYLLDFLDENYEGRRISYAASFGTDDLSEYDEPLIESSRLLAQRFDALSVRESSGVDIVATQWNKYAEHHVDPTMLLSREHYENLAKESPDQPKVGLLVDYVLDDGEQARGLVAEVARELGKETLSLIPPRPSSYREFSAASERFARPSVEYWLGAIGRAKFVVTDSFHGTVFALLHNVPFISVVNPERGAARFESLLQMFGLEARLIDAREPLPRELVREPIDWQPVNDRLVTERARSMDYLRSALTVSSGERRPKGAR